MQHNSFFLFLFFLFDQANKTVIFAVLITSLMNATVVLSTNILTAVNRKTRIQREDNKEK